MKPRSMVLYGVSGSTKTTQTWHIVKYLHGTKANPGPMHGKKWRMIHADGGGYQPFIDSGMIKAGIIDVFDFGAFPFSLAGWRWLRRGYWPRNVNTTSNVPRTSDGRVFMAHDALMTTPEEWKGIAGYIIEGLASCGEVMKAHISNQKEKVGFANSYLHVEEGEEFRGLDQGHYNIIQREIYEGHMKGFNNLPMSWLIYTSLLGKGIDKQQKETVYGPQIVGNASTPASSQWFMDCIHLAKEKYKAINPDGSFGDLTQGMVAWFIQHMDNNAIPPIPYLCKPRLLPEHVPKLLKMYPYGFIPLRYDRGMDMYLEVLGKLTNETNQVEWV